MMKWLLLSLLLSVAALACAADESDRPVADEDLVIFELETGTVYLELASEAAPLHAEQFRRAVRSGLYDDEYFYRVIEGHVAQAGLEFEDRITNWPNLPLEAERSKSPEGFVPHGNADLFAREVGHRDGFAVGREDDTEWLLNCPGALGMARNAGEDTGSVEFFIPIGQRRYLDRNYTIFGRVIGGMEHINRLKRVDPVSAEEAPRFLDPETGPDAYASRAKRLAPNRIKSATVAADLPEDDRPHWRVMREDSTDWADLKETKRDYSAIDAFVYTPPKVLDICTLPLPAQPVIH